MSALRVFKNFKNFREICSYKYSNVCFQSTNTAEERKDNIIKTRRYLKPASKLEQKPFNNSFLTSIFSRTFDKEILEYPQVFEEKDIDTIIRHSLEVEKFLKSNPKIKLTESTLAELKMLELFGLTIPQKYGGAGYNRTELNFLLECCGIEPQIGQFIGYNEDFSCRILSTYGSEEQKARYLPKLAEGQHVMALAYLEDTSMVDFANFKGYAVTDTENKGYILNSKKKWVHQADLADLFLVLVKRTAVLEEDDASVTTFNMFIVERNSPGVKVHKMLTNNNFENTSFFELDFEDAFVPEKNLLGQTDTCGVTVLKSALCHNFLTDATICCSLIKRLLHDACAYVQETKVFERLDKGYIMTHHNLSTLSVFIYALESIVYLISGRFDIHEEHDLFDECVLGKVMAIILLKASIQKYIEIMGCESLRASRVLDEALTALQYYSVLDENIEYLKMAVGSNAVSNSGKPIADKVKKLRNSHENMYLHVKELFKSSSAVKNIKSTLKLKMELHSSLSDAADSLETTISRLLRAVEVVLVRLGNNIMEHEHNIVKFAECAAYIYAATACLSRSNSSICYNFPKCEIDQALAEIFVNMANQKVQAIIDEEVAFRHMFMLYKEIGKLTFNHKSYPIQHPLTRTF